VRLREAIKVFIEDRPKYADISRQMFVYPIRARVFPGDKDWTVAVAPCDAPHLLATATGAHPGRLSDVRASVIACRAAGPDRVCPAGIAALGYEVRTSFGVTPARISLDLVPAMTISRK
jgi:hypothetical protein